MSVDIAKDALPPLLEAKLTEFRRRVWAVKLTEGLLAALFGLALSYLFVFILDRFIETPAWLRLVILLAGAATLGIGLPLKWHRWVWRQRTLEDVARLVRLTFPRLGDQLLSIVELVHKSHGTAGRSERLVQAAISQTADAVKDQDFTKAVPNPHHWQWGYAAAFTLALVILAFIAVAPAARNALVRWIEPWRHMERFTFAKVEKLPNSMVVPYDEPFNLPVRLSENTSWSPGTGWGEISGQPWTKAFLNEGGYPFVFPPQKEDVKLYLSMGDVRKTIFIQPRTRPELSEVRVHLKLPDYLGYKSEQTTEVRGGSVSLLKGSQASFEAQAIRNIESAQMNDKTQKVEDGKIVTDYEPITEDVDKQFFWSDHDGLTPHQALVLKVKAVEDEPPRIIARRDSLEQVVLDSETVSFDLTAKDDFGVKQVGLDWVGSATQDDGKTPVTGSKIAAAGANEEKEEDVRATFCATRDGVAPQTLEVRAWADDYLPGRPHVHSAAFILHVLNKTDHALWLTEQFGRWLEASKETYEREQQLNQTNKELRAMSVEDLDRPENRRKVEQQASAENANASRLGNLNEAGRQLVEQATKNDEFDAKRLESLATMLKELQDIAANKMPNVSDLLKQTANAPSAGTTHSTTQQQQQPPQTPNNPNGKTVAGINQGSNRPVGAAAPPLASNTVPKPPMPSLTDHESGFSQPPSPAPTDPNAPPKPPGSGKLRLPNTVLDAAPDKNNKNDSPKPPESPAQQNIQTAVKAQDDLLAQFAKVSDQLSAIMTSLEASTFVKRFKAAAKHQMKIASTVNQKTLDAFGIDKGPVPAAVDITKDAKDQSEVVRVIESDLDAYFQRKHDDRFKNTIDEMKKSQIVDEMAGDGDKVATNLSGQAIVGSDFWADTLDRWAEEMVAASNCKCKSNCSADSLPPEIVLKVMQALRGEMNLRDETRETENSKPALVPDKFTSQAQGLASTQNDLGSLTSSAMTDIVALPDGEQKFQKELGLLKQAVTVMNETQGILATPETGPKAIGAESDVIELLLQSKRSGKKGGGGGGSTPGGGGTAMSASEAALADFGPGSDVKSVVINRSVGQATGQSGKEFPEEFKLGLDSYFSRLENQTSPK